jgi:GWxTD domain-containing protein
MTTLETALGWALLHFLWQGAMIALILAAIFALSRPSARARYALACLAMLAMPVVFGVTSILSLPPRNASAPAPLFHLILSAAAPASAGELARPRAAGIATWLVPLWMAGVVFYYLHSFAAWIAAQRLRRVAVCLAPAAWQERLDLLARRMRLSRPVLLLESGLASVPVVIGFLRPAILVPAGLLAGLPPDHLESILIHELAHIRRCDYFVQLLQKFVEGLLFYHPAVWWISGVIRAEREHCCDDVAVALTGDARRYAAALAALEQGRSPAAALAASGGNLIGRIRRLLEPAETPRAAGASLVSTALVLVSIGVAWVALAQTNPAPPRPPAPPASLAPSAVRSPYQRWLEEDVAYIITPEEKAAFEKLQSDEERAHFIEQFWLRRDPTPGTTRNEFKEEYYRRIAYTNDRFAAGIPGWKTDRGRIYILYGPPDEIESHPSGPPVPFEAWRYHHIDGLGDNFTLEFYDPELTGEYRLAPAKAFTSPSGLTVEVRTDRFLTISVPVPDAPTVVYGRINDPTGRVIHVFEDRVTGTDLFRRSIQFPHPAGSYRLSVVVKGGAGTPSTESLDFSVK